MAVQLVCEGPADGLDVRVLNIILAQKLACPVLILPFGGAASLGTVARWLEERVARDCERLSQDATFNNPERCYDELAERYRKLEFLQNLDFLRDIAGHELLKELCTFVNSNAVPNMSLEALQDQLLVALDTLYRGDFFEPDDFAGLAARLV